MTIVIAYIYHVFGHLIQTIFIKKYVSGLLTGIFTSLFSLYYINDIPIKLYGYSLLTLLLVLLNLVLSFMILHQINQKANTDKISRRKKLKSTIGNL